MTSPLLRASGALLLAMGVLLLALPGDTGAAQADNVIYRCTEASGAVTFQNGTPCPSGTQQQRRVIDIPAPMPAFQPPPRDNTPPAVPLISTLVVPKVEAVTTTPSADDATVADDMPRLPPTPLFACKVYDDSTYYREDDTPPPRCRPLQTVGIGSLPGLGAGQACETVVDVCAPVPDDALCRLWETRVREAEFRWQYAQGRERDVLRRDYELLYTDYAATTCLR